MSADDGSAADTHPELPARRDLALPTNERFLQLRAAARLYAALDEGSDFPAGLPDLVWATLSAEMMSAGRGHDHEDDVQEALLSLLSSGPADYAEVCRIRWTVLRRRAVDRHRLSTRRSWELEGCMDDFPARPTSRNTLADDLLRESDLLGLLGERAIHLLLLLVRDGVRSTRGIARLLARAEPTIRLRRRRVCRVLRYYLRQLQD